MVFFVTRIHQWFMVKLSIRTSQSLSEELLSNWTTMCIVALSYCTPGAGLGISLFLNFLMFLFTHLLRLFGSTHIWSLATPSQFCLTCNEKNAVFAIMQLSKEDLKQCCPLGHTGGHHTVNYTTPWATLQLVFSLPHCALGLYFISFSKVTL